ncbi:MAG: glutamate decarboxylase [Firmicutes bacterium]|nr:glutamate decarboxylase [Bacillota bacterium]
MWTVIYIAPNQRVAESLREVLLREGLLVQLRSGSVQTGEDGGHVEVLVPESEAEEAHEVLATVIGRHR